MDPTSRKQRLVKGQVNPLTFLPAEEHFSEVIPLTSDSVIEFLCAPEEQSSLDELVRRYKDLTGEIGKLAVVPADKRVLEKLIWPLRSAIGSHMTGNFLGTIALCGIVAEMVAILIFELCEVSLGGKRMDEDEQEKLFGFSFERLGQDRRVKVLDAFGMIDKPLRDKFGEIRAIRKKYLHLWSQEHGSLEQDSVRCFTSAVTLVTTVIGAQINGWGVRFSPQMEAYLERKGLFSEIETPQVGQSSPKDS